jgi:hypothetical protein
MKILFAIPLLLAALAVHAQTYSIDWYKVAGGGGTSGNGHYSLSGTIGQPDAGGTMTGGGFAVTGGFWSIIAAVPTAGLPDLIITRSGNGVLISWPATGNYILQQNANLSTSAWTPGNYPITTANGTNSVTIISPAGNLFFRLNNP